MSKSERKTLIKFKDRKWEKGRTGLNEVLEFDNFYLSYNPGNHTRVEWAGDNNTDETAICVSGEFYILNGDYRETLEDLAKKGGLELCMEFYRRHPDLHSSWSTES